MQSFLFFLFFLSFSSFLLVQYKIPARSVSSYCFPEKNHLFLTEWVGLYSKRERNPWWAAVRLQDKNTMQDEQPAPFSLKSPGTKC
ncbi:uncharacterized protein BP01DRAFT_359682 [Aspergillus saccharolyticus JOP 1030-1]|uniref:Secreted protein n=1 Tax=Aspergillus saccharolyticus JOP 1030-1 TaxID=1450539 RepID=A0A318ZQ32_9EURO|nr:hypothetical protein BP01DRAFT_359682 [Aspergillus saccharolyticus JOP 1030-1]PYH42228.1 hypothetical protein BP01DRAFT_359682 [Aspergillus saccharolyticus JOP 1030-1]